MVGAPQLSINPHWSHRGYLRIIPWRNYTNTNYQTYKYAKYISDYEICIMQYIVTSQLPENTPTVEKHKYKLPNKICKVSYYDTRYVNGKLVQRRLPLNIRINAGTKKYTYSYYGLYIHSRKWRSEFVQKKIDIKFRPIH